MPPAPLIMLEWIKDYGQGLGAILTALFLLGSFWLKNQIALNRVSQELKFLRENEISHLTKLTNRLDKDMRGLTRRLIPNLDKRLVRVETILEAIVEGLRQNDIKIDYGLESELRSELESKKEKDREREKEKEKER